MSVTQVAQPGTLQRSFSFIPEIPMLFIFCSLMQQVVCGETVAGGAERVSSENSSSSKVRAVGEQARVVPLRSLRGFLVFVLEER